jgi:hypothetical protein
LWNRFFTTSSAIESACTLPSLNNMSVIKMNVNVSFERYRSILWNGVAVRGVDRGRRG